MGKMWKNPLSLVFIRPVNPWEATNTTLHEANPHPDELPKQNIIQNLRNMTMRALTQPCVGVLS